MCLNLNKCCCFGLKTGSLVIGVIDLIFGLIGISQIFSLRNGDVALGVMYKSCAILSTLAAVLLIIGVQKGYQRFFLIWNVVKIINLFSMVIAFVTFIIGIFSVKSEEIKPESKLMLLIPITVLVSMIVLHFYFWLVVMSFRRELKLKSFLQNNVSTA